jgi:hypothetical protein
VPVDTASHWASDQSLRSRPADCVCGVVSRSILRAVENVTFCCLTAGTDRRLVGVRVTERGKEACECAVKSTADTRRRPHSRQNCESTDRNLIQGRYGQASGPTGTDAQRWSSKPFSFIRIGKSSACAVKVNRPIQGGLESRSGSRLHAESRSHAVEAAWRLQQSAEAIVRIRHIPVAVERAEL